MINTIKQHKNQIKVTAPDVLGRYPMLEPGPNIELYINGKNISNPIVATEKDKIKIEKVIDILNL